MVMDCGTAAAAAADNLTLKQCRDRQRESTQNRLIQVCAT